jgi:hypothetical protein
MNPVIRRESRVSNILDAELIDRIKTTDRRTNKLIILNWFMHPVARVSINKYRNLRTQQMFVHSLVCIFSFFFFLFLFFFLFFNPPLPIFNTQATISTGRNEDDIQQISIAIHRLIEYTP